MTRQVKAKGVVKNGLYYLQDFSSSDSRACNSSFNVWHHILGHAPLEKQNKIPHLQGRLRDTKQVCMTCPMSKFFKLPFDLSKSYAASVFELLHIDTWGP